MKANRVFLPVAWYLGQSPSTTPGIIGAVPERTGGHAGLHGDRHCVTRRGGRAGERHPERKA